MSSRLLTAAIAALTFAGAVAPAVDALAQDHHGGGGDALLAGVALGAALGYYGGHPYYCRHHHHWRWSYRLGRYVYDYRNYC